MIWESDCGKLERPPFQNYFNMTSPKQRAKHLSTNYPWQEPPKQGAITFECTRWCSTMVELRGPADEYSSFKFGVQDLSEYKKIQAEAYKFGKA